MDELKELNSRDIRSEKPNIVKINLHNNELTVNSVEISSISNAHEQVEKTNLNVPDIDIDIAFDLARVDIPDFGIKLDTKLLPAETLG